jgi:hypothetical protein
MAPSARPFRFGRAEQALGPPLNWVLAFAASAGLWTLIGAVFWWLAR